MKLGVLGGTFDPIHVAHLALAEAAVREVGLSEVIFVPAGNPYFKPPGTVTPAHHRLSMVCLALAGYPRFRLSTIEVDRPGPSYTAETLAELHHKWGEDAELYFLLGYDSLESVPGWYHPEEILAYSCLVVAPRPGYSDSCLGWIEDKLPGIVERLVWLKEPLLEVSSSMIRERVAKGLSIEGLVPPPVADYIAIHHLYARYPGSSP